jgi:hypothetical protein
VLTLSMSRINSSRFTAVILIIFNKFNLFSICSSFIQVKFLSCPIYNLYFLYLPWKRNAVNKLSNILLFFHSLIINTFFLEGLNESIIESQKTLPAFSSHKWRNASFGSLCFIGAYNYFLTLYYEFHCWNWYLVFLYD